MQKGSTAHVDPTRHGSRIVMLFAFASSLLCAIGGFLTAGALGYPPF